MATCNCRGGPNCCISTKLTDVVSKFGDPFYKVSYDDFQTFIDETSKPREYRDGALVLYECEIKQLQETGRVSITQGQTTTVIMSKEFRDTILKALE